MSSQPRNDDDPDLQEAVEEEVLKLEEDVGELAQKTVDYRTTLSSSLLESHRPVLPDEPEPKPPMLPGPNADAGGSQGSVASNSISRGGTPLASSIGASSSRSLSNSGDSSSSQSEDVEKSKFKRKQNKKRICSLLNTFKKENEKLEKILLEWQMQRIEARKARNHYSKIKALIREDKILTINLEKILDPERREFFRLEQQRIMQKKEQEHQLEQQQIMQKSQAQQADNKPTSAS